MVHQTCDWMAIRELTARYCRLLDAKQWDTWTVHQVHAPEITIAGNTAERIWAMQGRLLFPDWTSLTGYGHYTETYIKRGGAWNIARTALTRLHLDVLPAT